MTLPTLVAYASRYGSTREIAEAVAGVLRQHGLSAEIEAADNVGDLDAFGAMVLGSALYGGNWLDGAAYLLQRPELEQKPLWLFSSGPAVPGNPATVLGDWRFPLALEARMEALNPHSVALFSGKIDGDNLTLEDWCINRSMRGLVGDYRDWKEIRAWAAAIASKLKEVTAP